MQRPDLPLDERVAGGAKLIYDFDSLSMSRFLTEVAGFGIGAVDAIDTLENITSRMPLAFIHSYIARTMINPGANFWELVGGSWRLPYAFEEELSGNVLFDRRVVAIRHADGRPPVSVDAVSEDGRTRETITSDLAIVTLPCSALRHVDIEPMLSYPKRRAVMELHYDAATKVLLEFPPVGGVQRAGLEAGAGAAGARIVRPVGRGRATGSSATARPPTARIGSRTIRRTRCRAARAAWSWPATPGQTTRAAGTRWATTTATRTPCAACVNCTASGSRRSGPAAARRRASWARDDYAFGEAATFTPGQFTEHRPVSPRAEGVLHFAGEHTSLKHSWIEGALESAARVVLEIFRR